MTGHLIGQCRDDTDADTTVVHWNYQMLVNGYIASMRLRNTFLSNPPTPPRFRRSNDSTNSDLSTGHTDAPSSPSAFADTSPPSASEPEISGRSDGGAGTPLVDTADTPASTKEEEESAPAWNEAARLAPGHPGASPTPALRPPEAPGVKPPSGRRPAPLSTSAGAKSSTIWRWKRGSALQSKSAPSSSASLPIESVLSTESENSLEDYASGRHSSESGWPSTDYFFPLSVDPAKSVYPSEPHSAIEKSGSASPVGGPGELQAARSLGLELDGSNFGGEGRPGRYDCRGEDEDGDDEALPDERTTRIQLNPAVPFTPASVRESLARGEYQLRRYFVASSQAAAAESAQDTEKAATDGRGREGQAERDGRQSRHHHEVRNHRRRWSNPFAAAASAIRVAPPHPPPSTGLRGREVAIGEARASSAASTSALTRSGTKSSTTWGSSSSTFQARNRSESRSPRCSLHPYFNADGTGTSSGPGGGDEAEVGNSEEQENASSNLAMKSAQLFSEVERSYTNGGGKKWQDNTTIKRNQHASFGASRETEEDGIGEREERITKDYAVGRGVPRRHSAGGSRTPLLDSPFFCKENGTEDIGMILRNDQMRKAFKLFLESRWCAENLDFVEQVMSYQKALLEMGGRDVEVLNTARHIEELFVVRGSRREVNIGQDMQQCCMRNRLRDVERGEAGMDTFNAVVFELISMMAHTTLRDFKLSAAYCAIDSCLHEGPRDKRFSDATSSMTYDDDELEDMAYPRPHDQPHRSDAEQRVADWYGLDLDETTNRTRTW